MRTWSVLALAIGVGVGSAQVTSSPNTFSARFGPPQPLPDKPIANEPYSGERIRDEAWTGAAGVHSSSWLASREYRDSAGRTRTDQSFAKTRPVSGTTADRWTLVTVVDPVAGVRYVLDVQNKIAHRQALPPAKPAKKPPDYESNPVPWLIGADGCCGFVNEPVRPASDDALQWPAPREFESLFPAPPRPAGPRGKKLGIQTIEGFRAKGIRYTENGRSSGGVPVKRTQEIWTSTELKVPILSRDAFQTGARITAQERLIHISRTEPDPALFQVPSGYRVVDETAGFAIPVRY
jgi:hypothetical protein